MSRSIEYRFAPTEAPRSPHFPKEGVIASFKRESTFPLRVVIGLAVLMKLQLKEIGNGTGPDGGPTWKEYQSMTPAQQATADEQMARRYVDAAGDARDAGDDEHSDALSNTSRLFFRRR